METSDQIERSTIRKETFINERTVRGRSGLLEASAISRFLPAINSLFGSKHARAISFRKKTVLGFVQCRWRPRNEYWQKSAEYLTTTYFLIFSRLSATMPSPFWTFRATCKTKLNLSETPASLSSISWQEGDQNCEIGIYETTRHDFFSTIAAVSCYDSAEFRSWKFEFSRKFRIHSWDTPNTVILGSSFASSKHSPVRVTNGPSVTFYKSSEPHLTVNSDTTELEGSVRYGVEKAQRGKKVKCDFPLWDPEPHRNSHGWPSCIQYMWSECNDLPNYWISRRTLRFDMKFCLQPRISQQKHR